MKWKILAVWLAGCAMAVASQPNVLFIFCDDLNRSVEGFGGHPQAKTPNIDRLAKRGVSFTDAHSNNPVCGPSRASIWNGLHPHTTGYYGYSQNNSKWRDNPVLKEHATVFDHFYRNGYEVLGTGKIFHNNHGIEGQFKLQDGTKMFGEPLNYGPYPWDGKGKPPRVGHPSMKAPWATGKFAGFESL
jgi:arylsulfatase A-like enzyme